MADVSQSETSAYRPWDREEKLGPVPEGGFKPDDPKVIAWEAAHGHDLRLKCLPEYGCFLLEARAEQIEEAARELSDALEYGLDVSDTYTLEQPDDEPISATRSPQFWRELRAKHLALREALDA